MNRPDVVVVGSGPNGLAAALTMARAGLYVEVYEGAGSPGGACRTDELTLPGFRHDVCATAHPLLAASPFFQSIDLSRHGVRLLAPEVAFAHPLDNGDSAAVVSSVEDTALSLGTDASAYRRLFTPLVDNQEKIVPAVLGPLRALPAHPFATARFISSALPPRGPMNRLETPKARALLAGAAAHAMMPLEKPLAGAIGVLLTLLGHGPGWPVVEGGTGRVVDALVEQLTSLGGRVLSGQWIRSFTELPAAGATLLDVGPRQFLDIAGPMLPRQYRRSLQRFKYGPGVCKVDWALGAAVPWRAEACRKAGTVHLGGTMAEIATSEVEVAQGRHPLRPYCIVVQPGIVDPTRAPPGRHTLWAYCHVPHGSDHDMTEQIESQIERFAPGFRDLVLARLTTTASEMERGNPNDVGGDINGGMLTIRQMLGRPTLRWNPYRTPIPGVYLCSASTPPGGGVHGMCGRAAARTALADLGLLAPGRGPLGP